MRFVSTILLVFIAISAFQQVDALKRFRKTKWTILNEILDSQIPHDSRIPQLGTIMQKLDHFDVTNTETFRQVCNCRNLKIFILINVIVFL
jgi:hypothetical protein